MPVPQHRYTQLTSPDRILLASDTKPPGFATPPEGEGIQRYLSQQIEWVPCDGFECATVLAPLDWFHPDIQAITLSMKRKVGSGELGYLFVNPGGPGGSAQDFAARFQIDTLSGYHIIGLDSRGSGASTPVVCGNTEQLDAYYNVDSSPDNQAERDALLQADKDFAAQCRQNSGELLDHISTIETIYDYDLVRQLLGQEKLNFYGVSYGTYLGAVYAELYPQHTGRLILDAAVNITDDDSVVQVDGFELSFNEFASWCAGNHCALGSSQAAVVDTVNQFLRGLDAAPIPVGERMLTQTLAATGIATYLYQGERYYPTLASVISAGRSGDGQALLNAADVLNSRTSDGYTSMAASFPAISCKDSADKGLADIFTEWEQISSRDPVFGFNFGTNAICEIWSAEPAVQIDFSGAGAAPLLVIGSTGDNATPYQYAQWMAAELESAVLVTRQGVGHGAYGSGNSCINDVVVQFLTAGTVPPDGYTC